MNPEIVVTGSMYPATMQALDDTFVTHHLWKAENPAAMLASVRDRVRGIATTGGRGADAALMDALPKLEIISCFAVGVDAVDLAAAKARGIAVTNTPDVLTEDVADLAVALTLAVERQICLGDRFVRGGKWPTSAFPYGRKLGGRTMGIVGLGRIGLAVAQRAAAFGMTIAYHGPREKPEGGAYRFYPDLVAMARDSDVLAVTCPGGAATRHLIGAAVLEALGPKGILVNVSRGSVVDEAALVGALQAGKVGGAGLDVFQNEPQVPEVLFGMDNVVLLPHIGSQTHETRAAMGQLVVDNLKAHFAGRPLLTRVV
jgi:lactate dehydrogenase-like 2-hydroxyacid dehydrogenase